MTAGSYTALLCAYGKAGDARGAKRVFDQARAAGVTGPSLYTALQQTYVRQGDLARAQEVFHQAEAEGWLDSRSYYEMILAYCEAGHFEDADRLLAVADEAGCLTDALCIGLIRSYGKAFLAHEARRVFHVAEARGLLCIESSSMGRSARAETRTAVELPTSISPFLRGSHTSDRVLADIDRHERRLESQRPRKSSIGTGPSMT